MARSQNTFNKKEREKKKLQRKKEKAERREEKKNQEKSGKLEDMMAYVDEYGNIVDTPQENTESTVDASDIVVGVPKKEKEAVDAEKQGKVAFFNEGKGFGFIDETGSRERYFVHVTGLTEPIQEGDKVSFQIEKGPKGMVAVNVKIS